MKENLLVLILLIHFLADFAMQTDDQAKGKSSSWKWLLYHTGVYSAIWFIAVLPILTLVGAIAFTLITFGAHTITDYITSRIGKPFWAKGDTHYGFVTVGFDQMLHYIQLYLTLKFLL